MAKLEQVMKSLDEVKKQLKATAEEGIKESLREYFNSHPDVKCLHWSAWTPYFNDGEPCEFNIHELWGCKENLDYHGYSIEDLAWDEKIDRNQLVAVDFQDVFGECSYDTLEDVLKTLGEGSVLVNKTDKGIEIEVEYVDHD